MMHKEDGFIGQALLFAFFNLCRLPGRGRGRAGGTVPVAARTAIFFILMAVMVFIVTEAQR